MLAQDTMRTCKEEDSFFKQNLKFDSAVDVKKIAYFNPRVRLVFWATVKYNYTSVEPNYS